MSALNELIQTESPALIRETLDFLLYECSIDDAPSAEEVAQWRDILQNRGRQFRPSADICTQWLAENPVAAQETDP
ncbi:MAG: dioxygenase [Neisseria sp.]|nr:dioxygenase [Neisseria sp.]